MHDRYIRAMLRAATAAKILDGWQGPHVTARSYSIAPSGGGAMECPLDQSQPQAPALQGGVKAICAGIGCSV